MNQGNTSFSEIIEKWAEFLGKTGDIISDANLVFLRKIQDIIKEDKGREIPGESFYIQEQAGFFRFRIFELITGNGEKYQVNFHVFLSGDTRIHSHGYKGHSFVLDGRLEYKNFEPQYVGDERQRVYENIVSQGGFLLGADREANIQKVRTELFELLLGRRGIGDCAFRTKLFAAGVGGGDDEAFGSFTNPEDIKGICIGNDERFYDLTSKDSGIVEVGDSYGVGRNEAHFVSVGDSASTLFLTHRPEYDSQFPGGEYENFFPERKGGDGDGIKNAGVNPRERLLSVLSELKI
ncbi:hypothetical protein LAT59_03835 [Candidatus Gracilibacteria bacterium]|nr:hypothetical protein [Candidatus Gracilibacteria bacterium]